MVAFIRKCLLTLLVLQSFVVLAEPRMEGPYVDERSLSALTHLDFDTLISRGDRLEFFRKADFEGPCLPCLTPQHVDCQAICYEQATNLTLICSANVQGLSIGPFDGKERTRILEDLLKTDRVLVATSRGEEALDALRISSQRGSDLSQPNYGLDLVGFRDFREILIRATTHEMTEFQIRVGPYVLSTQLHVGNRNKFDEFLRQCPSSDLTHP